MEPTTKVNFPQFKARTIEAKNNHHFDKYLDVVFFRMLFQSRGTES